MQGRILRPSVAKEPRQRVRARNCGRPFGHGDTGWRSHRRTLAIATSTCDADIGVPRTGSVQRL